MVYKSINHGKLLLICFLQIMGKVLAELASFSVMEGCVLHVLSFLLSVLLWTIAGILTVIAFICCTML